MPFSRSRSIESMTRSATSWLARKAPDCQSMASTRVVLPWSTWATIATLRRSERRGMARGVLPADKGWAAGRHGATGNRTSLPGSGPSPHRRLDGRRRPPVGRGAREGHRMAGGPDWVKDSFRTEYEHQSAATGRFNLAVFGKTGVGKSTLVNAIFGEEVARTGIGEPVTKGSH